MPNIRSAEKRVRQTATRTARNKRVRSLLKNSIRRFEETLQSGSGEDAQARLVAAVSQIDKAAAKGIIHKNNAARKKSRLNNMYNRTIAG